MALTLSESAKLSNDVLVAGVIETIIQESPVLQRLPFIEVVGNSLTYNRENRAPTASFYSVGDTWTESTPTFTQVAATLKILGGDADIDNFLKATRSNIQDLEAAVVQLKAKALQSKFEDTFVNGDRSSRRQRLRRHRQAEHDGADGRHGDERRDADAGQAGRGGRQGEGGEAPPAPDVPPVPP